jgi:hypothetical protein
VAVRLVAADTHTGQEVALSDDARALTVTVVLPLLPAPTPASLDALPADGAPPLDAPLAPEVGWLVGVSDRNGFAGYLRLDGVPDPVSGTIAYQAPIALLHHALFLPVVLEPAAVANYDATVHLWSSPFADATDLGMVGNQWVVFEVLGPQFGDRIFVRDPYSGAPVWIDASGVGPV